MKNNLCMNVFILLMKTQLLAHPTLLLTKEEIDYIQKNFSKNEKNASSNQAKLYLSAIIYIDTFHWSLQINDKIIRSDNFPNNDHFHIEKVLPHKVMFSWVSKDTGMTYRFYLRPHQTYFASSQKIVEGKF